MRNLVSASLALFAFCFILYVMDNVPLTLFSFFLLWRICRD